MAAVFGAREVERHEASGRRAAHVELTIGDGVVVVEAGELPPEHKPTEASVYVYVEDVDAVYERAVEAGALYGEAVRGGSNLLRSAACAGPAILRPNCKLAKTLPVRTSGRPLRQVPQ